MGWLKRARKKLKKFGRTKFGKVLKVVGGIGLAAAGVGVGVKLARGIEAAKGVKGIGAKVRVILRGKKGIGGSADMTQEQKKGLFGGSIDRLSRKIKRKAGRKAEKYARKLAKYEGKQASLEKSLEAARESLGSGGVVSDEVDDSEWLDEQKKNLRQLKREFNGEADEARESDADESDNDTPEPAKPMSSGAKTALGIAGGAAVSWGLKQLFS